jgi:PAS domain S-box-containing protein
VDAPLRALLVEESAEDAEAILGAICDLPDPCQHRRVSSPEELREALAAFAPDVVLADHAVPGFGDHEALSIVQAHDPLLPFVYVAGTVGEEVAIEAIRRGAADFVLKENLRRLPSVVGRALESARERRERLRIEAALRESEERFRSIVENSHDWIWEIDRDARLTYCNAAVERMLGHAPERLLGQDCLQLLHPHDRTEVARRLPALIEHGGGWRGWRLHWLHHDGSVRVVESTGERCATRRAGCAASAASITTSPSCCRRRTASSTWRACTAC